MVGIVLRIFGQLFGALSDLELQRILCSWKGFHGGASLDAGGCLRALNPDHMRERDKALLRSNLAGQIGGVFKVKKL